MLNSHLNEDISVVPWVNQTMQQKMLFDTFTSKIPNADNLLMLATNKPWIELNILNNTILQIKAGILRETADNTINGWNTVINSITAIANEIYEMLKKGTKLSVHIETFVWKKYILSRINNFPEDDIGDWIKDACEARSYWAKRWIEKPTYDLPILENAPITVSRWTLVSDKYDLIYTIKFWSENK